MKVFLGILWLFIFFAFCFGIVHLVRAIFCLFKKKPNEPPPRSAPPKPPEPVYYLVEKKTRRKKTYSEPKQIHFKE
ncbi:MAG: hypothetical protein IJF39_00830 [Clostridia bacterium]|nr:hypothetical protein [Clostridia bacterium]